MLRAFLIVALMLFGAAPALAQTCHSVSQVVHDALSDNSDMKLIAHLDEKNAGAFMASANESTKAMRDEKEVLIFGNGLISRVVLFKEGCASGIGTFPAQVVDKWLHGVVG